MVRELVAVLAYTGNGSRFESAGYEYMVGGMVRCVNRDVTARRKSLPVSRLSSKKS